MSEILSVKISPKINYACYQNDIAILKELRIYNNTNDIWENIEITLDTSVDFIKSKKWQIEKLNPGEEFYIKDRRIELNHLMLRNLEESVNDKVIFSLFVDKVKIEESEIRTQILAYNEWGGVTYIPELLAAFVTPNADGIDSILGEVGRLLSRSGKNSSIDGYTANNPASVWDMVSALYTVISNKNITYSLPPASFEQNGQKIRFAKDILLNRVGTCLDISLLFASALEQMGLFPLLLITKNHAFIGVWLKPMSIGNMIIDDTETLRKRIDLNELLIFDAVTVTNSPKTPFTVSKFAAEERIAYGKDGEFEYALDVHIARGHKIMPLSVNKTESEEYILNISDTTEAGFESAPADLHYYNEFTYDKNNEQETTRLNIWQKKLLNLSTSNPLLNCRITQTNIAVFCPEPDKLEDYLADGVKMSLVSAEKALSTKIDPELRALRTCENILEEQAKNALKNKQLIINVPEAKIETQLVNLYRKTKSILEEGGSNTLYLAIGFLNWKKKNDKSEKIYHAPLILCPVKLERVSIKSGIKLSAHEDESRFNTTLLQMLKQDFEINIPSLEYELPMDESGLDVKEIWNRVRLAVKEVSGFEVVEEVVLGHFSFNKYLMWKDLIDRTDAMMEHPYVAALIDKEKKIPEDGEFISPNELDNLYKPSDFYTPLAVDSSQLAVIAAADKGKSFVIEGPPGTGKSQTISNLIAHLMTKGKTVLFVSEKMAALDVVYRRLEKIGLGNFCLQLHSNKANKKEVLGQLKRAWEHAVTNIDNKWDVESEKLLKIRNEINDVINALHKKGRNGLTPYYAMSVCIKNNDFNDKVRLNWESSEIHSEEDFTKLKELVHKISIQANSCNDLFRNKTLQYITSTNWDPIWQQNILNETQKLPELYKSAEEKSNEFIKTLNVNTSIKNFDSLKTVYRLAKILKDATYKNSIYALKPNGNEKIEILKNAILHLNNYENIIKELHCECPSDIWKKIDGEELAKKWNLTMQKSYFLGSIDKLIIKNRLRKAGASGNIVMPDDAKLIAELKKEGLFLNELDKDLNDIKIWKSEKSNIKEIVNSVETAIELRQITAKLTNNTDELFKFREILYKLISSGCDLLENNGKIGQILGLFIDLYEKFIYQYNKTDKLCSNPENNKFSDIKDYNEFLELAETVKNNQSRLKDWIQWEKLKDDAFLFGIIQLIEDIESGNIEITSIEKVFETAYCSWWANMIISENTILKEFSSLQFMDKINQFVKLDSDFQDLTIKFIQSKLAQNIPPKDAKNLSSEWKLIQRETQKQRQIKPVRQLLTDAGSAVKKLTPCMMMSPLSVAQYLPVSKDTFDVVVFDEASQITVWDAIGTLSRGAQIIVAGDSKQMPPSNFFGRNTEYNEEELGIDEDLESILDELIGSSLPTMRLNWHYRSRCESLIAFSNERYYESSLVTFPSSKTNQKSVSLHYIEGGCYERGNRINKNEANAIVKECVKRLQSDNPEIRNKSIGIVTFNAEQQKLIEDLLDIEREKYPEIEFAFNPENPDSIFVKNLETVQGDERDVIFFSITYGPDSSGKVSMNFGPLNRIGGERRLNVAFTRSKYEMVIFSSLQPDQIDLNRTNSQGVADLKAFLQYAARNAVSPNISNNSADNLINYPFESEVKKILIDKGWKVHTNIGASSYKIDIAIVNPDNDNSYIAGIQCDGLTYKNASTARDREIVIESVLKGLGWNIIRVWSMDWWLNKENSINDLCKQLDDIYNKSKTCI